MDQDRIIKKLQFELNLWQKQAAIADGEFKRLRDESDQKIKRMERDALAERAERARLKLHIAELEFARAEDAFELTQIKQATRQDTYQETDGYANSASDPNLYPMAETPNRS